MNPYQLKTVLLLVLLVNLSACDTTNSPATVKQALAKEPDANGAAIFADNCVVCHGPDGTSGIGGAANLQKIRLDSALIIQTLQQGKNGMPSFENKLTVEEQIKLEKYVLSLHK